MMKPYRLRTDGAGQERASSDRFEREGMTPESSTVATVNPSGPPHSRFVTTLPIILDPARVDPHLVTLCNSDPLATQQYERLVVSLISTAGTRPKRLLVTSAKHGEGRTSVVLNLAGALANAKLRVLVIETDLSRPSMLRLLGAEVVAGLPECLAHGVPLAQGTVKVLPCGFSLLATRSRVETSVEVLRSPTLRANLQTLEPEYDFMLFDSPPLLVSPDPQMLLNLTDRSLLVIRPGLTTPTEMSRALAIFKKEDFVGVVLNRSVAPSCDE
jgi:Mrp family chromosome partitioning ATPase